MVAQADVACRFTATGEVYMYEKDFSNIGVRSIWKREIEDGNVYFSIYNSLSNLLYVDPCKNLQLFTITPISMDRILKILV